MLSIIICHRNIELLNAIKDNIKKTVGIPYELIIIDNSDSKYSIFSAYNEGVKRAKNDILCFVHEDILFHTNAWGKKVLNHFTDVEVGMIGVSGGMAQSEIPSPWWTNNYFAKSARYILMKDLKKQDGELYSYYSNPFNDENRTEVIIIDGMWFCIRKSLFEKISFDEITFKGYHLYDADISMQVLQYSRNYVAFDILVEHRWSGKISEDYYTGLPKFTHKWKEQLPIQTSKVEADYFEKYNWHALRNFILEIQLTKVSSELVSGVLTKYLPVARKYKSQWFELYFNLSKMIGYKNANRIFYRLEKLSGFCKLPGFNKTLYKG
jgi:hypothetical protein